MKSCQMIYGLLVLNASTPTQCVTKGPCYTPSQSQLNIVEHVADKEMLDRMLHIAKHLPSSLHTNNSTELNWCFQKKYWESYPTSTLPIQEVQPNWKSIWNIVPSLLPNWALSEATYGATSEGSSCWEVRCETKLGIPGIPTPDVRNAYLHFPLNMAILNLKPNVGKISIHATSEYILGPTKNTGSQ